VTHAGRSRRGTASDGSLLPLALFFIFPTVPRPILASVIRRKSSRWASNKTPPAASDRGRGQTGPRLITGSVSLVTKETQPRHVGAHRVYGASAVTVALSATPTGHCEHATSSMRRGYNRKSPPPTKAQLPRFRNGPFYSAIPADLLLPAGEVLSLLRASWANKEAGSSGTARPAYSAI
jgi:hypothetical protein